MSERAERMIQDYPGLVMERDCLRHQLQNFQGVTEQDVIDSMNYSSPEDERVQTSSITDKTASIAAIFRDRAYRLNRDWIDHLTVKLLALEEEIGFFHSALRSLPPELAPLMWDLAVERMTWDNVERKYHFCRATIGKYRKKAISELDSLYAIHDKEMAEYILR